MTDQRFLRFTVPGAPVPTARAGRRFNPKTGRTHSFTPKRTRIFQNLVRMAFIESYPRFEPVACGVRIYAHFYMPIPASMRSAIRRKAEADEESVPHIKKPDGKNMRWGIEDALEGVLYNNDSQIWAYGDAKTYSSRPRTEIEISIYDADEARAL